jgi:hypothetical protein
MYVDSTILIKFLFPNGVVDGEIVLKVPLYKWQGAFGNKLIQGGCERVGSNLVNFNKELYYEDGSKSTKPDRMDSFKDQFVSVSNG